MLTDNELQEFLDKSVTAEKFSIFSALSNLDNSDNFRRIIELLQANKINYLQLNSLDYIDDQGISELLDKVDKYEASYFNDGSVPINGVYSYIYDGTSIENYFVKYNERVNELFGKAKEKSYYSICTVNLDNSIYISHNDFEIDFQNKVVTNLLKQNNIENVNFLFPEFQPNSSLREDFKNFIGKLYSYLFDRFKIYFNNEELSEVFVWSSKRASVNSENNSFLNNIFNLEEYSINASNYFSNDLHDIAIHKDKLEFTQSEVDNYWSEILNIELNDINISETLAFILYKINFINSLEQKNGFEVNSEFELEFRRFLRFIPEVKTLFSKVEELIYSNLNVERI